MRKKYEAKVVVEVASFKDFRRTHVEFKLKKYDMVEKMRQEDDKWRWLPLYQIFKKWPLSNYNSCPWDHTKWDVDGDVCSPFGKHQDGSPLTRERTPSILRAIMYLV